jgi:hypothetical protein
MRTGYTYANKRKGEDLQQGRECPIMRTVKLTARRHFWRRAFSKEPSL